MKYDLIKSWLDSVAISHSNSERTREEYRRNFQLFCDFINKTADEISEEYEGSTDRQFRRKYAKLFRAFISNEYSKGWTPCTVNTRIAAVKSFFKYNDLPLGYVPSVRMQIIYHNRDISREEVKMILDASNTRERAFYAVMAQSGLRPETICMLRYKHVKTDLEKNEIPCKIDVPMKIAKGKYRDYFTFMGDEAVKYLKAYLNNRSQLKDGDYLFAKQGTRERVSPKSLSALFGRTVKKLKRKGLINVEQREKGKPSTVRLYSLRKFFRKYATQAGRDYYEFWMGHTTGIDEHYRPTDVEHHRKLYAEKAMPFLRLETPTPSDTNEIITILKEQHQKEIEKRDNEIQELRNSINEIRKKLEEPEIEEPPPEYWKQMEKEFREYQKWLKEHPQKLKKQEIQEKEYEKWQEDQEEAEKMYREHLETELDKLQNQIKELQNIIKQTGKTEKQS